MIWVLWATALAGSFDAYDAALSSGDKRAAANALVEVIAHEESRDDHAVAWSRLADLFGSFSMPLAALYAYSEAVTLDPSAVEGHLTGLFSALDASGDEAVLGKALAGALPLQADAESRGRLGLAAARSLLRGQELGGALEALARVGPESSAYADAQAMRGVVLAQQGLYADALAPLVTAQTVGGQTGKGARFDDLLDLNIARAYFGAENWGQAIAWYAKVDRQSDFWPEAQFERAWAHFRADDMQGTLSLLHTHQSPFFDSWNFAEADLLRAYALFLLCKFPEARERIDRFAETYGPLRQDLDATLASLTAPEAFTEALEARAGRTGRIPIAVLRPFVWEDRFGESVRAVSQAEDELERLASQSGEPFADAASSWLVARRDAIIRAEGERILTRARAQASELHEHLKGIELTRIDLLDYETKLYERAATTGALEFGDRIGRLRKLRKTRGVMVWPFQGEYWEDELGWYRIDARADCPADLAVNPGVIQQHTLENGLRVVVDSHTTPVAAVYLWFDVGSASEAAGEEGTAHFLEHMLFKGSARRGVGIAAAEIEGLGGDLNAFTSYDETVFHATVQSKQWRQALDVLADMTTASTLDADELERERLVVLEEIRSALDDPEGVLSDAVQATVFADHPYARPILGSMNSVRQLTREQLLSHWRRGFRPDNAILAVAGDVDADEVITAARSISWPEAHVPIGLVQAAQPGPSRVVGLGGRFETTAVEISWPGPPFDHPDVPALEVLLFLLSVGDAALLTRRLQREQSLASDIWGSVWAQRAGGTLSIGFLPRENQTAASVAATLEELRRVLRQGVSGSACDRARTSLLADLLFATETMDGVAYDLCWYLARHGDLDAKDRYRAALSTVTGAEVRRVARTWLQPQAAIVGYVDRGLRPKKLEALLERQRAVVKATPPKPLRHVFDNGSTLWVLPDSSPIAALRAVVLGGGLAERPRSAGTRMAWSRLVTTGAGPYEAEDWAEAVDRIAGVISASNRGDTSSLSASFPADNLLEGLDLCGHALASPHLRPDEWERIREEALEELDTRLDRADEVLRDALRSKLYPGHPWRLPALGTPASLRQITSQRIRRWHRGLFTAESLVVAVAGGVDPEAVRDRIAPWIAQLPTGPSLLPSREAPRPPRKGRYTIRAGREQAWVVMATAGFDQLHPQRRALELASAILGGQGGRLFIDLRERLGLAYSVWSDAFSGLELGRFQCGLATDPERASEARDALERSVDQLAVAPPPQEELDRCRRMLLGQAAMGLQRASGRAAMVAFGERLGLPWGMEAYERALAQVTPEDVSRALAESLHHGSVEITVLPLD